MFTFQFLNDTMHNYVKKKNTKNIKTGQNYTAKKAHTQIYHIHPEMTSKMAQKYQNVVFKKQKLNLKMFSKIKPWSFHPKMLIVKGKTSRSFLQLCFAFSHI